MMGLPRFSWATDHDGQHNPACFLATHGHMENDQPMPPCDGRLIRAHLISRQELKRHGHDPEDRRSFVLACGGITGCSGHHGALDGSRRLRLPRLALPVCVEELAAELGIGWYLDRTYGPKEEHDG